MTDKKLTDAGIAALTTPTDDDIFYAVDDPGGSPAGKKITWANIKATLKTYFDTLYGLATWGSITGTLSSQTDLGNALLPAGYLFGLTLTNSAGDLTNDIAIATGKCKDSTDAYVMVLGSSIIKRLDAAWAVGTNQGGLDTGAIANNTYHIWLIKRSDTGVVDALFSLSATDPTMPANYDSKRRIGSIIRLAAAILLFHQVGDIFALDQFVADQTTVTPADTNAATVVLTVPTGVIVEALINTRVNYTSAGNPAYLFVPLNSVDRAPSATADFSSFATSVLTSMNGTHRVFTNLAASIRRRASIATSTYSLITTGWIDTRGRPS